MYANLNLNLNLRMAMLPTPEHLHKKLYKALHSTVRCSMMQYMPVRAEQPVE